MHARKLGSFSTSQIIPSVGGIFLSSNNKRWNLGLALCTKIAFNIHNAGYIEFYAVYNDHIVSPLFFFFLPQKYKRASCYRQNILVWSGTGRGFQWKVDLFQGIMGVQGKSWHPATGRALDLEAGTVFKAVHVHNWAEHFNLVQSITWIPSLSEDERKKFHFFVGRWKLYPKLFACFTSYSAALQEAIVCYKRPLSSLLNWESKLSCHS